MERFKRAAWAVVHPPIWLAFILTLSSFALVIWTLASGQSGTPLAYLSYGLSAYALVIVCVRIPGIVRACRTGFEDHPLVYGAVHSAAGERLRGDAFYRAQLSLYMGLGVNLLYVVIKAASGIVYQSRWFGVLAGYYLLLSLEKAMLTQFGEPGQERFSSIMVGLTGIAVCASVLALAIEMIRRANRAIAHLKKEEHFS